ncbi:DctP family TRAP transporter solute-binding subunit [Georgenia sunbinii]|uniref:DctP family TRAP transporter solute-binding subunit n=1 Tax=Georgenia sunbinii TaxID=3117728 RepID=UPI002F263902
MSRTSAYRRGAVALSVIALTAAACGGADEPDAGAGTTGGDDGGNEETVTLSFAHSYATNHPHQVCGVEPIQEQVAAADVGLEIEIFPDSSLGGHAERFASVVSGDIDIDIQGPSEISATYPAIGVLDAAYAIEGPDHLFTFFESPAGEQLREDMLAGTGVRTIEPWYFGMRHFTSNTPLETPADFEGLRMRFPDTPQFLQNAEALGASPTSVAFEEVYISLQQGVVDGQENPIPTIASLNLPEVQSHLNLTGHMTGIHMIVMNEDAWQSLSPEQQEVLETAIKDARDPNRDCIEAQENEYVEEWGGSGTMEIIEPDIDAFRDRAESFFLEELDGDALELYTAVRETA